MFSAITTLILAGIPAVFLFLSIQGISLGFDLSFFQYHWFLMIYGFFNFLIGNELLIALSREWSGKTANLAEVLIFYLLASSAILSYVLFPNKYLAFLLLAFSHLILLYHSRVYLRRSWIGLKPRAYNYLIIATLIITSIIEVLQIPLYNPAISLLYPSAMIFAVMSRDVSLVLGGKKVNQFQMSLAYIMLVLGFLFYSYNSFATSLSLFLAWLISFVSINLFDKRGRLYSKICLGMAWSWLLISSIFVNNLDVFVHSISVGFLFNTIFGVDVILMDLLLGIFNRNFFIKSSYIPVILLNLGIAMRFGYDLLGNVPIFLIQAPLQGLGIISFYLNTFYQIIQQLKAVEFSRIFAKSNK